jgi:hypothetical protein
MSSNPDYVILASYTLGAIICAFKAAQDFKSRVPYNQTSKLRIFIHTLLFTSVVLVIYVGLVKVLVGLAPQFQSPFLDITTGQAEFEKHRIIAPIIIAVLFFGATQATIRLAGKDIQVYESLLQVFVKFIAVPFEQEAILRELTDKEIESLEDFHEQVFRRSKALGIGQQEHDSEIAIEKSGLEQSNDRIRYLEELRSGNISIDQAMSKLEETVDQRNQEYLEKLMASAKQLIETNTANHLFADFTLKYFDIDPPPMVRSETLWGLLMRTVAMSVIGAVLIAGVVEAFGRDLPPYSVSTHVAVLFVSIFTYLMWFVWLDRFTNTLNGFCKSIVLGVVAGFCGGIVYMLIDPETDLAIEFVVILLDDDGWRAKLAEFEQLVLLMNKVDLIQSALMGSTASVVVHCFRFYVVPRIRNILGIFCLMAPTGFLLYFSGNLVWVLISDNSLADFWVTGTREGIIVGVLTIVIALVSNVLHREIYIREKRDSRTRDSLMHQNTEAGQPNREHPVPEAAFNQERNQEKRSPVIQKDYTDVVAVLD